MDSPGRSTRELLRDALKDELTRQPLDRVTVSSLCRRVGITRQAFYYHFSDVYQLAAWTFEEEIAKHIMQHATYDQWADGLKRMLIYLRSNQQQTYAAIGALSIQELEIFFLAQFRAMMRAIVAEIGGDITLRGNDRDFVIDHYALSILGHVLWWLSNRMQQDPHVLVARLEKILNGSVRQSLERFSNISMRSLHQ